jgi:ribonuclease P protein component
MLPQENRLKLNKAKRFGSEAVAISTPGFRLLVRKNTALKQPHFGIIVTSRVGKAAQRNRLRRLLTNALRTRVEEFPQDIEAVFIIRQGVKDNHEDFVNWINYSLSKIH